MPYTKQNLRRQNLAMAKVQGLVKKKNKSVMGWRGLKKKKKKRGAADGLGSCD